MLLIIPQHIAVISRLLERPVTSAYLLSRILKPSLSLYDTVLPYRCIRPFLDFETAKAVAFSVIKSRLDIVFFASLNPTY